MSEETKTAYYDRLPGKFMQTQWTNIVHSAGEGGQGHENAFTEKMAPF